MLINVSKPWANVVVLAASLSFGVAGVSCASKDETPPPGGSGGDAGSMTPGETGGAGGTAVSAGGAAGAPGGAGGTETAGAAGVGVGGAGGATGGEAGAGGDAGASVDAGSPPPMNMDSGVGNGRPDSAASDAAARPTDAGPVYSPCPPKGTPCVIMPLGDSITEGAFSSQGGGYRLPLFRLALRDMKSITFVGDATPNGPAMVDGVPFPRTHEGHGGFTIDTGVRQGISPLVQASMVKNKPHIVTLMIGTNDVGLSVDNLPTRLGGLVDKIVTTDPNVLIVLAQIVPTATASNNARVRAYNVVVADVAKARADAGKHIVLVDMYTPFVNAAGFPTSILADDLHPNDAGYAIMAQVWYDKLKPVLP